VKKKLKIISIHIKNSPQAMPLGPAILTAQIESTPVLKDIYAVEYSDYYIDQDITEILNDIIHCETTILGFSIYSWNREKFIELSDQIRKVKKEIIIFGGGAEATAAPESLLIDGNFDFVISGEGELPLIEALTAIHENRSLDGINAVYTIKNSEIIIPVERSWNMKDLNLITSPFLKGALDPGSYDGVLWELSRGCPFRCSFCFESRGNKDIRYYTMDRLKKELTLFEEKRVNQIFVLDPTFNYNRERAKDILKMIIEKAPYIHYTFEVRSEFIDAELADLFSRINCSLQIGLQSVNPEVLKNINRSFKMADFIDKISLLNSRGIIFGMDLIFGLPCDTLDSFMESLDFALSMQPNHLDIFPLSVLPGTELYEKSSQFCLNFENKAPYTIIDTPGFTKEDMEAANKIKEACDIFYNQGGAAGWMFMICETLETGPAELLRRFSDFIETKDKKITPASITKVQSEFTMKMFSEYEMSSLFRPMDDIIKIHGALKYALKGGPVKHKHIKDLNTSSVIEKSPGTCLIKLNYFFDDLMEIGTYNLHEFIENFRPEPNSTVVYNFNGEPKPLTLDKDTARLINSLNGKKSIEEILDMNKNIEKNDLMDFVNYALSEGIFRMPSKRD